MTKNTLLVPKEKLEAVIKSLELDDRTIRILNHRFGLNGEEMHSERSTGHIFGVQRNTIRYWEIKIAGILAVDKIILTEILTS